MDLIEFFAYFKFILNYEWPQLLTEFGGYAFSPELFKQKPFHIDSS